MFASISEFWNAHSALIEGIVAALLPSVITALTNRPDPTGKLAIVLAVLRRLSVLTHADDDGTMKAPLTDGKAKS